MALKSELAKVEEPKAAPLTVFGSADDIKKMFESSNYLPEYKIVHPIEAKDYIGRAIIKASGDEVEILEAGYTVGILKARLCARLQQPDGKWSRSYKGGKSNDLFEKYTADHAAGAKSEGPVDPKTGKPKIVMVEPGKSALVAIWTSEDRCALATCEMHKTMVWYLQKMFASAIVETKAVVKVKLASHLGNLDAQKDTPTMKYFAAKKFKRGEHWEQMEVTAKQLQSLELAVEANRAAILQWEAK